MCEQGVCWVVQHIAGLVGPQIWLEFGYFLNYDSNIENLRIEVRTLDGLRAGVEGSVNAATRSGEVIRQDVVQWQANVSEIISEANTFLADVAVRRSFYDWSRYSVSKEAKTKTGVVTRLQMEGRFTTISYPPPPPNVESLLAGDFVAFQSRTSAFDKVIQALKDDDVNTVGVCGMGGGGKTTLVKQIGQQVKRDGLFHEVLMVVVSRPPNIRGIQDEISEKLGFELTEKTERIRAERLLEELDKLLKSKKILVILDDVWSELELADDIGIPSSGNNKNLKIVLTTRREQVCRGMDRRITLNVLDEPDSWNLFRVNVGDVVDSAATLNVVAREVASECCGLPIALVTVGRALRNNGNLQQWKQAAFGLRSASPTYIEGVDKEVYASLKLSYDFLPSEESREMFLLCCLFPEDHDIEIETLVHYAAGKRLFQGLKTNPVDEVRSRAYEVIENIKESCLLLKSDKEDCIKVHDVVRDVGISIASANDTCIAKASIGLKEWPRGIEHCMSISLMYNDIRELPHGLNCPSLKILLLQGNRNLREIPDAFFEEMVSLEVLDLSYTKVSAFPASITRLTNLRTLQAKDTKLDDVSILGKLKNLEILDLENSKTFPLKSIEIGQRSNLRVLNLNGYFQLSDSMFEFISSLSQLEELYLLTNGAPDEVENIKWKSLSHLKILHIMIEVIEVLPKQLCERLEKFYIATPGPSKYKFSKRTETTLCLSTKNRFVGAIKVLLERTEELEFFGPQCWRNVILDLDELGGGLQRLQFLRVDGWGDGCVDGCDGVEYFICASAREVIDYFPNLRNLYIDNLKDLKEICHGLLPQTKCFGELSTLGVCGCGNLRTVIPFNLMSKLLNLEDLEVRCCERVEVVFDSNHEGVSFPQEDVRLLSTLTVLTLEDMDQLQKIWKGPTQLVCLRNLKHIDVQWCEKLREIFSPTISQMLLQLEDLKIISCDELEEVVTGQEEEITVVDVIIFPKLNSIRLMELRNLKCFCSGRISFQFPALETLIVQECCKMKTFTSRSVSTPNLKFLELDDEDYSRALWLEDLNHTIQNSYNTNQEREEIEEGEDDDPM